MVRILFEGMIFLGCEFFVSWFMDRGMCFIISDVVDIDVILLLLLFLVDIFL